LNDADPERILFVGRFDRHKGGDLIIDAFGRVLQDVPEARLWFVGPDRGYIDANGRTWHIEEYLRDRLPGALESKRVEWLGAQPFASLAPLRRKALVCVVCPRYENLPLVVLETMALGCPLVAASVGGIPEVIDDHANGLLHCAGSSDDLAAQIISLLNDPKRAAQLGKQAAIDSQGRLSPETVAGGQWIVMARLSSESDRGNEQAVRFSCRFRAASAKIRLGFRVYGLWNQLFGMIGPYKTLA